MANMIARLGVVLGLDSAEFSKGLDAAGKKLEQFSQNAEKFGRVAATALVAATGAALKYADELADVAQANEVAIGTVLKLSDALANSGGKADNAGKMLSAFTKFIDDAASGSDQAQKTAAKLGVSIKDLGTLSQEELLNKFVKNIAAIEDPITRGAKGMEVFSKAAKGVDLVEFGSQMAEANKITAEQEEAIKQAAEMFDLLAQNARNAMLVISTSVGPTLKAFGDYIKDLNGDTNDFGEAFKIVFQAVAIVAANVLYVVKSIFGEIFAIGNYVANLVGKNWATAEAENDAYIKKTIKERQALDDFYDKVMNPSSTPKKSGKPASTGGRKISESKESEAARKKQMQLEAMGAANQMKMDEEDAKARADFFAMYDQGNAAVRERQRLMGISLKNEKELMLLEMNSSEKRQEDYTLEREQMLIRQRLAASLEEIDNRRDLTATARLEAEERENQLAQQSLAIAKEKHRLTKNLREGSFEEGVGKQAARFLRDMPTELEMGQKAFDSLMGNMESAIDRFVRTGKLSFKDLAKSIIQDIIAIQMKAMATKFLSSLFGGGGFTNDAGGRELSGSLGFADGGNPPVGRVSIVGERGPELFVPKTAGTIVPNHALSGMGGTTNVTNNYINAIDTKSFEDRLLGSSTAIWAANKYGEKNLATNYGRT